PSASLVPENDPTALFNTAGMQPLVPYLMGKPHPQSDMLANIQKCIRTTDIEDVGDSTHLTFFEMMGNWSLGSYFKEDAIKWSYKLLTSKEEGFGLDPNRLYITVFKGDENSDADLESKRIWESIGISPNRIYSKDASANWWPAVKGKDNWTGPTGPCSEMFYDLTLNGLGDMTLEEYNKADEDQKVVEIWNDVFMEYEKKDGKIIGKLQKKNVDTGAGLERIVAVLQGKSNVFETDLFSDIMLLVKTIASDLRSQRIISDHIRSSIFMISDGVIPSNTDRGYIVRRLLRRAIFNTNERKLSKEIITKLVDILIDKYADIYKNISIHKDKIIKEIFDESEKFGKTLVSGLRELEYISHRIQDTVFVDGMSRKKLSGLEAFNLYQSYGFPIELTLEICKERGIVVDIDSYNEKFKSHQALSRSGAQGKFKGGLGDTSDMSLRYHTATHLLHQALHDVLGDGVGQKGSNITPERLRFDFSYNTKMTDEEKKRVEDIVNEKIKEKLPVNMVVLSKSEAEKTGARHLFEEKYADDVSVYFIGGTIESAYSKEFCGGPHVKNTSELAGPDGNLKFKIQKEEASSQGIRRIKAVLL
ncbi:MAG: alanine--tRNA ligase, partial [Patescibacteria group bacterium]